MATYLLGPPRAGAGERDVRLWYRCPCGTHEDNNPSFCIDPGKKSGHCFGCGKSVDAVGLVRLLNPGMTFPEALAYLVAALPLRDAAGPAPTSRPASPPAAPAGPSGLPESDALALVGAAAARLWSPEGSDALAYLTGPRQPPPTRFAPPGSGGHPG